MNTPTTAPFVFDAGVHVAVNCFQAVVSEALACMKLVPPMFPKFSVKTSLPVVPFKYTENVYGIPARNDPVNATDGPSYAAPDVVTICNAWVPTYAWLPTTVRVAPGFQ